MGIASKYNKAKFDFKVPDDFKYNTKEELFMVNGSKKVYILNALYINHKGKFGDQPVYVTDKELVNGSSNEMEQANRMLGDDEFIEAVNNHKVGFTIYQYKNKYGTQYGINWIDL